MANEKSSKSSECECDGKKVRFINTKRERAMISSDNISSLGNSVIERMKSYPVIFVWHPLINKRNPRSDSMVASDDDGARFV